VNRECTERSYAEEHLAVARRGRKRANVPRVMPLAPGAPNQRWSMDFVRDTLADGRAFRSFTLDDDSTRERPASAVDAHRSGERGIQLGAVARRRTQGR
jgi:putative transposase